MKRLLLMPFALVGGLLAVAVLACGGGGEAKQVRLGDLGFLDKGTKDASGMASISLKADDFYFEPTFLRGTADQKLKLTIQNASNTIHNLSVSSQPIDKDIPAKGQLEVEVTFPQSGVLLFICKYHTGQGMNGELLAGSAAPQSASFVTAVATVKVSDSSLGKILTDPTGRTLYTFNGDVPGSGKSMVSGRTLESWPPLILISGAPVKSEGLTGDLTLIDRDEGTKQVAYKGRPVYYYARDAAPGETNGQGAGGGNWFVVAP